MSIHSIPMSFADLPQQRVYEVKPLPAEIMQLSVELLDYEQEHGLVGIPNAPTKQSLALAQVEWSWSPMHSRVDQYVLHKGRDYWLLWCGTPDDNAGIDINHWFPTAILPISEVGEMLVGVTLLKAFWDREMRWLNLEKYHWINAEGMLSVADLESIAVSIWPSDEGD